MLSPEDIMRRRRSRRSRGYSVFQKPKEVSPEEKLQNEINELKKNLQMSIVYGSSLKEENDTLKEENVNLNNEAEDYKEAIEDTQRELMSIKRINEDFQEKFRKQKEEITLSSMESSKHKKNEKNLLEKEKEIERLKKINESIREDLKSLQKELDGYEDLKEQIMLEKESHEKLRLEKESLRKQIEEKIGIIVQLRLDIGNEGKKSNHEINKYKGVVKKMERDLSVKLEEEERKFKKEMAEKEVIVERMKSEKRLIEQNLLGEKEKNSFFESEINHSKKKLHSFKVKLFEMFNKSMKNTIEARITDYEKDIRRVEIRMNKVKNHMSSNEMIRGSVLEELRMKAMSDSETITNLQEEVKEKIIEQKRMNDFLEKQRLEIEESNLRSKLKQRELEEKSQENLNKSQELENLKEKLTEYQNRFNDEKRGLNGQIQALSEKKEYFMKVCEDLEDDIKKERDNKEKLVERIDTINKEMYDMKRMQSDSLKAVKLKLAEKQNELGVVERSKIEIQMKLKDVKRRIEEVKSDLMREREKQKNRIAEIKQLKEINGVLEEDKNRINNEMKDQRMKIQDLRKRNSELKRSQIEMKKESEKMLLGYQEKIEFYEKTKIRNLNLKIRNGKKQINILEKKLEELNKVISNNDDLRIFKSIIQRQKEKIRSMAGKNGDVENTEKFIFNELRLLKNIKRTQKGQIDRLKKQLFEKEEEQKKLNASGSENKLKILRTIIQSQKKQLAKLREENRMMEEREKNNNSLGKIIMLKNINRSQKSKIKQLQTQLERKK